MSCFPCKSHRAGQRDLNIGKDALQLAKKLASGEQALASKTLPKAQIPCARKLHTPPLEDNNKNKDKTKKESAC
jgi:hypothetical protein